LNKNRKNQLDEYVVESVPEGASLFRPTVLPPTSAISVKANNNAFGNPAN
jgi:hypothetical protein